MVWQLDLTQMIGGKMFHFKKENEKIHMTIDFNDEDSIWLAKNFLDSLSGGAKSKRSNSFKECIDFICKHPELRLSVGEIKFISVVYSLTVSNAPLCPPIWLIAQRMGESEFAVRGYLKSLRKAGILITRICKGCYEYNFAPFQE